MLNILSLFSGIGAFERALENIGVDFKIVNYCEIDKYASKSYSLLHKIDERLNIGDITKVDPDNIKEDIDLITWGFPCTDISISGYQKGFTDQDGNLTRSGLFYEGMRIINAKKPKIAICENVKNITGNRFKEEFEIVLTSLEKAGYNNYWKVLNAKDFGVPQNRERVFIISIRKDIDKGHYEFPEGFPLTLRLKDILEKDVDEKYYIPDELVKRIKFLNDNYSNLNDTSKLIKVENTNPSGKRMNGNVYLEDGLSPTITTNKGERPRIAVRQIGNCMPTKKRDNPNQGRIYDINGLSPTLTTAQGGGRTPFVALPENNKCTAAGMRGRYKEDGSIYQNIEISNREYANTITTVQKDSMVYNGFRIRKLTPTECFILMGFNKEDAELLALNKISNTQLYKQSGNSIVVNVLEHIFIELKKQYPNIFM